jgi:hypothetical protein
MLLLDDESLSVSLTYSEDGNVLELHGLLRAGRSSSSCRMMLEETYTAVMYLQSHLAVLML